MTTTSMISQPGLSVLRRLRGLLAAQPALILVVVAIVFFAVVEPKFLSAYNIRNLAEQSSSLGIMAIGLALVLLLGGIDLSVPATMAAAAVLGAIVMVATQNTALGVAVMLGAGLLGGALNGLAITVLGLVPFAVTLATMTLAGGLAVWLTEGTSIFGMPQGFAATVMARLAGVPSSFLLFVLIAGALHWTVSRTRAGRMLMAVGTNRAAARVMGIPVRRVEFLAYVACGLAAGVAAVILTARLESASGAMGSEAVLLDVVAAAVVGGVSIYGGRGTILGAALGAVFVTCVGNGLNLMGFDYFVSVVIKGSIVLAAIALDAVVSSQRRRWAE
jgi:ribose/xylose/arabinose/galactoside ABC-type transport system permease subunit